MIGKRVAWFVGGVAAGAAGAGYAKRVVVRTARRTAETLKPTNLVKRAAGVTVLTGRRTAGGVAHRVGGAMREGRAAMRAREAELRARRDHHYATLDEHLAPGDQLIVDGQPVDTGRVYVLKRRRAR